MTPRRITRWSQVVALASTLGIVTLAALGILGAVHITGAVLVVYATIAGAGALAGVLAIAMSAQMSVESAFAAGVQLASRRGPTHVLPMPTMPKMRRAWPRLLTVGFVAPFIALLPVVMYETNQTTDEQAAATRALAEAQETETSPVRCMRLIDGKLRSVTCEPLKSDEPSRAEAPRCWLWINSRDGDTLAEVPCGITVDELAKEHSVLRSQAVKGSPGVSASDSR